MDGYSDGQILFMVKNFCLGRGSPSWFEMPYFDMVGPSLTSGARLASERRYVKKNHTALSRELSDRDS